MEKNALILTYFIVGSNSAAYASESWHRVSGVVYHRSGKQQIKK